MRLMKLSKFLNIIIILLVFNVLFVFISKIAIDFEHVVKLLKTQIAQAGVEVDSKDIEKAKKGASTSTTATTTAMTTTITTTTLNPALFDEAYWLLYDETTPGESASESAPEPAQKATRAKGPVNYHYITASFGAACYPGGLSNKLFEFVSLVGIARSVRRKAFILGNTTCVMAAAKEISSYFPSDVKAAERISEELFGDDTSHRLCVHIRRGDFVHSAMHQHSTEEFIRSSIEYVRNKLKILHRESLVALIGDDVLWAKSRFRNDHWARIPSAMSKRPTIDYAFFAQHCQSIILTASASTFGFWSAYLSSATAIYYNSKFDKDNQLTSQLKPEDFFPPGWIPLHHNISTNSVIEIVR